MTRMSWLSRFHWRYFSKPTQNRPIVRSLLENQIGSVLEIGVGDCRRMEQILSIYSLPKSHPILRYTAVDLFESGPSSGGHRKLRDVHRLLAERGVKAHLIPGEIASALPRVVQTVMPSDLVIIDRDWDTPTSNSQAMKHWLPKLCHENSIIFARNHADEIFARQSRPATHGLAKAA